MQGDEPSTPDDPDPIAVLSGKLNLLSGSNGTTGAVWMLDRGGGEDGKGEGGGRGGGERGEGRGEGRAGGQSERKRVKKR